MCKAVLFGTTEHESRARGRSRSLSRSPSRFSPTRTTSTPRTMGHVAHASVGAAPVTLRLSCSRGSHVDGLPQPKADPSSSHSIVFGVEVVRVHENREGDRECDRVRPSCSAVCSATREQSALHEGSLDCVLALLVALALAKAARFELSDQLVEHVGIAADHHAIVCGIEIGQVEVAR